MPATLAIAAEGYAVEDVSERIGVSRSYVSHILAGRRPMTSDVRAALVAFMGDDGAERVIAAIPSPDPERLAA